jgi:hypothetical protein
MAQADALLFPGAQEPDVRDWDFDGREEICLRSDEHLVIVAPGRGGEIQHWDLRRRGWHLTHAVARRPEAYHSRLLTREEGDGVRSIHEAARVKDEAVLAEVFRYDRGMRLAAQDTLLPASAGQAEYHVERLAEPAEVQHWSVNSTGLAIDLLSGGAGYRKTVAADSKVSISYDLPEERRLFSEWNLSLPPGEAGAPPEIAFVEGACRIVTGDFSLECRHNASEAWVEQLFSVSNTEGGVELAPQGWSIVFASAAGSRNLTISWGVET